MRSFLLTAGFRARSLYYRVRQPITLGVRCLVERSPREVLLIRHTYRPGWYFPGGAVDRGETLEEAVLRELEEEVGVTAKEPPQQVRAYSNFTDYKSDHVVFYRLAAFAIRPRPNLEVAELGFYDPAHPPEGTTPGTLRRLAEVYGGAPPGSAW